MKTLKERFQDWTEVDIAIYEFGQVLGLIPESYSFALEAKWICCSANPLGEHLYNVLNILVSANILEQKPEDNTYYRFKVLEY